MIKRLALALALMSAPAFAQQPAPRQTVGAIAAEIRELYFSAEKGEEIAHALEAEAAAGKYDKLTDPQDLAAALSNRLRPEDAHFRVLWSPEQPGGPPPQGALIGPGPGRGPGPGPGPGGDDDPQRLLNYGFTRVQNLPGNVGLIEMGSFADIDFDNPDDPARRSADAALALVANADAVIFDLRGNGGGSPAMVGYLVSAFTPPDAKIYNVFHSRQGTREERPDKPYAKPRLDVPVYVLISGRTGSAAEAFPYTLQGAKRAKIVGEASGGAANPGGLVPVPGGFRVFVSAGSPINPMTGKNWEGVGVQPDLAAPAADALGAAHTAALKAIIAAHPARADAKLVLETLDAAARPIPAIKAADYTGAYGPLTVAASGNSLEIRNGRRPPLQLVPLGGDIFFLRIDPVARVVFERDPSGRVVTLEQRGPSGPGPRQRRAP